MIFQKLDPSLLEVFVALSAVLTGVFLLWFLFVLDLWKTLALVPRRFHRYSRWDVWLLLIPVFGLFLTRIVCREVSYALEAFSRENPGLRKKFNCSFFIYGRVPLFSQLDPKLDSILLGLSLFFWIKYWVKICELKQFLTVNGYSDADNSPADYTQSSETIELHLPSIFNIKSFIRKFVAVVEISGAASGVLILPALTFAMWKSLSLNASTFLSLMIFSFFIFLNLLAGYFLFQNKKGGFGLSLIAQALQIFTFSAQNFHFIFYSLVGVFFMFGKAGLSWKYDFGTNYILSFSATSNNGLSMGINLVALLIIFVLLFGRARRG